MKLITLAIKVNQAILSCVLGFIILLVAACGASAFTGSAPKSVQTPPPSLPPYPCLYTGEQIDPDLGMYYLRARYYQPGIGRFWTLDSYEGSQFSPSSQHKYLYCNADPVNLVDPSGHFGFGNLSVGSIGSTLVSLSIRATPLLNKATVIAFEAVTGNTVFLGGAGSVVALKAGTKLGGVPWSIWQSVGNLLRGQKVGTYKQLAAGLRGTGEQANHLNQAAAFPRIPYDEGVSAAIQGGTNSRGSAHWAFHDSLEAFWKQFRQGGARFRDLVKNSEYDDALRKALEAAGHSPDEVNALAKLAEESRRGFGYFDGPGGLRPTVPNGIPGF